MNKTKPLVSVVMPVFNCGKYVEDAVKSVLDQSYDNIEIIIVDDGSTDSTYETLERIVKQDKRIKLFRNEENMRIVKTLNRGISKCTGKYIARMDGDDYREADSIEKQVDFLEKNLEVVLVGGAVDVCDGTLRYLNHRSFPLSDEEIRSKLFRYNPIAHPTIMVRGEALKANQYELNWAEDYDLYFRLGEVGKLANLPDTLLRLRVHPASVSRSKAIYQEKLVMFIRLKAVFEYGYKMSFSDKVYFMVELISIYIVPMKLKFWVYNTIRSLKK